MVMGVWVRPLAGTSIHRTINDIHRALFGKYLEMPLGEIEQGHSGDLLSRSTTALRRATNLSW